MVSVVSRVDGTASSSSLYHSVVVRQRTEAQAIRRSWQAAAATLNLAMCLCVLTRKQLTG